jgi:hypothetical protein
MRIAGFETDRPADGQIDRHLRLVENKHILLAVLLAAEPKLTREQAVEMLRDQGLDI